MREARLHNLFISQSWGSRPDELRALQDLLDEHPAFAYRTYSITKRRSSSSAGDGRTPQSTIATTLQPCHVVLISMARRPEDEIMVDREMAVAAGYFRHAKPVIAIRPPWMGRHVEEQRRVDAVVDWSSEQLVETVMSLCAPRGSSPRPLVDLVGSRISPLL